MATPLPIDITQIALTEVTITRFEVAGSLTTKKALGDEPTTVVDFTHRAEFAHDAAQSAVGIRLGFELVLSTGEPASPTGISGKFELTFGFKVGNLADLFDAKSPEPGVHPQLLLLLTSVAFSTARGILWTRLAGTALDGVALPLIDPRQLLEPEEPTPAVKKRRAASSRPKKPKPTS